MIGVVRHRFYQMNMMLSTFIEDDEGKVLDTGLRGYCLPASTYALQLDCCRLLLSTFTKYPATNSGAMSIERYILYIRQ